MTDNKCTEECVVSNQPAQDDVNHHSEQQLNLVEQLSPSISINAGQQFWRDVLKSSRYILAPMVDQSELAFRLMVRQYKVECTYSPMFNASIFVKDPKYRKDCLQVLPELDKPLIIQFCANKPETFVEAAKIVAPFCEAIDLNLGCPQIIAKRGHYGAFLQDEWELIHDIVSLASKEVDKPITCKIRIFEDIDKTVRYAKMIESAGAALLGVHGRYREQKGPVTGLASWDHIKAVKSAVKVPVFANGNIQSFDDVKRCLEHTQAEGVMSAEGILHNPAIFTGKPLTVWDATRQYIEFARAHPPPSFSYVRGHVFKFLHHCLTLEEHQELRRVVSKTHLFEALAEVANELEKRYKPEYEEYMANNHHHDETTMPHPDTLPIFFCKPYYRPLPTEFNSKIVPKSETPAETKEIDKSKTQQPQAQQEHQPGQLSKRQLKKMKDKSERNKKLRIGDIEEDCTPIRNRINRKLELCTQCKNPKGAKCEFNLCKKCCRIKTYEEVLDCKGHRFEIKSRQMKAAAAEEGAPAAAPVTLVESG